jgi:hypothetical protein
MSDSTSIDTITNNLILKYKDRYNQLYEQKGFINSAIMNKEEIILKENEEIKLKDDRINILKNLFFLSLFICAFIILYSLNIFPFLILILGIIGLIIIFSIFIYIGNKEIHKYDNINKKLENINMPNNSNSNNLTKNYKCPSKCNNNNNNNNKNHKIVPEEEDYWKYTKYTSGNYNSQGFGDGDNDYISDNFVYYKCDWVGGNNYSGISKSNKKYSSIPCNYKQNYTQTGKYICLSDPNDPETDFNKSCTDVTYY